MNVEKTNIKGLLSVKTDIYDDNRGWFTESYNSKKFAGNGVDMEFIQDNYSLSIKKGTLKGIHFQNNPMSQTKLVRCTKGAIIDTAVDLRKGSDT